MSAGPRQDWQDEITEWHPESGAGGINTAACSALTAQGAAGDPGNLISGLRPRHNWRREVGPCLIEAGTLREMRKKGEAGAEDNWRQAGGQSYQMLHRRNERYGIKKSQHSIITFRWTEEAAMGPSWQVNVWLRSSLSDQNRHFPTSNMSPQEPRGAPTVPRLFLSVPSIFSDDAHN